MKSSIGVFSAETVFVTSFYFLSLFHRKDSAMRLELLAHKFMDCKSILINMSCANNEIGHFLCKLRENEAILKVLILLSRENINTCGVIPGSSFLLYKGREKILSIHNTLFYLFYQYLTNTGISPFFSYDI